MLEAIKNQLDCEVSKCLKLVFEQILIRLSFCSIAPNFFNCPLIRTIIKKNPIDYFVQKILSVN